MKKLRRKIVLGVFISATVVFALTILIVSIALNADITRERRYHPPRRFHDGTDHRE